MNAIVPINARLTAFWTMPFASSDSASAGVPRISASMGRMRRNARPANGSSASSQLASVREACDRSNASSVRAMRASSQASPNNVPTPRIHPAATMTRASQGLSGKSARKVIDARCRPWIQSMKAMGGTASLNPRAIHWRALADSPGARGRSF
jgi:hypothetical protein